MCMHKGKESNLQVKLEIQSKNVDDFKVFQNWKKMIDECIIKSKNEKLSLSKYLNIIGFDIDTITKYDDMLCNNIMVLPFIFEINNSISKIRSINTTCEIQDCMIRLNTDAEGVDTYTLSITYSYDRDIYIEVLQLIVEDVLNPKDRGNRLEVRQELAQD